MKRAATPFPLLYEKALRAHLQQRRKADLDAASGLGGKALASGLLTLDLAKLHEKILIMGLLPSCPAGRKTSLIRRAGIFFAAAIAPACKAARIAKEPADARKVIGTLAERTVELAASNHQLGLEIIRRKEVETSLKKSERNHLKSLEKANVLKEQLRGLSRQILTAQEDERKKISRELHDVIAQALMGINVRLATLKKEAAINTKGLDRNIALTQRMVTRSANIVHQFARELRPTALDDLGLIPALHSFMKSFTTRTGVRTHLTVFAAVEKLNATRRTVIYRVVQEALTNVARHAHASRVEVTIRKEARAVCLEIDDDGRSFQVQPVLLARGNKRLGLLGMRERVEMVGGVFLIESVPGKGTKITARIPVGRSTGRKWQLDADAIPPEKP